MFDEHLAKLLQHEGNYSNNPSDNGGETYKGITKKYYGLWEGWRIIDATDDKSSLVSNTELNALVAKFYKEQYWDKLRCSDIKDDFNSGMLFNLAINVGKNVIVKKVQRILKVTQDGELGPKTIEALNSVDSTLFMYQMIIEMTDFYVSIAAKGNNNIFLRGWLLRILSFYYDKISK